MGCWIWAGARARNGQARSFVVDAFDGSGTTLIASAWIGPPCYAIELDPHYVRLVVGRREPVTGLEPEKVETDLTSFAAGVSCVSTKLKEVLMSIENRNLKPGTKLVAMYKGQEHTAEVVKTDDGLRYRLADGQDFKSPSSAASAVMCGNAANGWRFWSIGESTPESKAGKARAKQAKPEFPAAQMTEPAPGGEAKPE